jgi:hypothetical protein
MNFNIELDGREDILDVANKSYLIERRELVLRAFDFGIEPSASIEGGEFLN